MPDLAVRRIRRTAAADVTPVIGGAMNGAARSSHQRHVHRQQRRRVDGTEPARFALDRLGLDALPARDDQPARQLVLTGIEFELDDGGRRHRVQVMRVQDAE